MIPQHVKDAYKEPHRVYHTTEHIESILEKIPMFVEAYDLSQRQKNDLEELGWYHDVVYIPGSKFNEADSSEMLMKERDYGLFNDQVMAIANTATHRYPKSFVAAIFFDLDLADMGTDKYYENSLKIREEFKEFSDLEWLAGRQKFLADFLSRPFIFHTSLGYKLWEEQARRNMELELSFLKGKYNV